MVVVLLEKDMSMGFTGHPAIFMSVWSASPILLVDPSFTATLPICNESDFMSALPQETFKSPLS